MAPLYWASELLRLEAVVVSASDLTQDESQESQEAWNLAVYWRLSYLRDEEYDGYSSRGLCHIELMDVSTLTISNKWYHRVYGLPPSVVFVEDRQDGV